LSRTLVEGGEIEASAVYAGPSLSHAQGRYWVSVGVLPQVFAPKASEGVRDLDHNEALWVRLLLGVHL
jgi:hypothetical protein